MILGTILEQASSLIATSLDRIPKTDHVNLYTKLHNPKATSIVNIKESPKLPSTKIKIRRSRKTLLLVWVSRS